MSPQNHNRSCFNTAPEYDFLGQPFRIGGELFTPVIVILIRHTVLKIADIFAEIKDEFKMEVQKMRNDNKPMKNQTIRLKWVVKRKQKSADGKTVYLKKRGCKFE